MRRCRSRDCFLNPPFSKPVQSLENRIQRVNRKMPIPINFFNIQSCPSNHMGTVFYTLKNPGDAPVGRRLRAGRGRRRIFHRRIFPLHESRFLLSFLFSASRGSHTGIPRGIPCSASPRLSGKNVGNFIAWPKTTIPLAPVRDRRHPVLDP